jgi:hypothetical protein
MKPFEARIIRTDGPAGELPTSRIVLVLTKTPEEAIEAFRAKYPGWTVDLTGRESKCEDVMELPRS